MNGFFWYTLLDIDRVQYYVLNVVIYRIRDHYKYPILACLYYGDFVLKRLVSKRDYYIGGRSKIVITLLGVGCVRLLARISITDLLFGCAHAQMNGRVGSSPLSNY